MSCEVSKASCALSWLENLRPSEENNWRKYYNIYNIIYFYIIYIYVENCESMKWRRLLSDRSNGNVHSYPFIDHFPVEHGWVAAATVDESLIWARNQGNLVDESGRYTPVPAPNSPGLT
jgi:hypothetical protein